MNILSCPKRMICLLLLSLGSFLFTACGNKGPLYLPGSTTSEPAVKQSDQVKSTKEPENLKKVEQ